MVIISIVHNSRLLGGFYMLTNAPTFDITKKEAILLVNTEDDLINHGKTNAKCPRCDGSIVMKEFGESYVIGCEHDCVKVGFRGI